MSNIVQNLVGKQLEDVDAQPWYITSTNTYGISNTLYYGRAFVALKAWNTLTLSSYTFNGNDTMDINVKIFNLGDGVAKTSTIHSAYRYNLLHNVGSTDDNCFNAITLDNALIAGNVYRIELIQATGGVTYETLRINGGKFTIV